TATGTSLSLDSPLLPSPSSPTMLSPQLITVPLRSSAYPSLAPAAIAVTSVRPLTGTGTSLACLAPFPSCPHSSCPQDTTVPFASSARPNPPPAAMAVASVTPLTCTGTSLEPPLVPMPRPPPLLSPHAITLPCASSARLSTPLFSREP